MIRSLDIPASDLTVQTLRLETKDGSDIYILRDEEDENLSYGMDELEVRVTRKEKQR